MEEHWLSRITELFTSETDDLIELARIAGYDAKTFYRGTLTAEQIDRLLQPADHLRSAGVYRLVGDLGDATAWLPADFNEITTMTKIFSNEMAVLEAFLGGNLNSDVAAIVLTTLFPEEGSEIYSAGLELLHVEGGHPMLIFEGPISRSKSTVPIISSYNDAKGSSGRFDAIEEGDILRLDRERLRLIWERGPGPGAVVDDALSSVFNRNRKGRVSHHELTKVLAFQVDMLEEALSLLSRSRQRRVSMRPFVRTFSLLAKNVGRLLDQISALGAVHHFFDQSEELHLLMERLWRCAVIARRAGYASSALTIHQTQLLVIDKLREVFSETWVPKTAGIYVAIGDIHARSNNETDATASYAEAYDLLRHESVGLGDHHSQVEIAEVLHKLSGMSRRSDRPEEEAEYAELAARAIRETDHVFADRSFLELKGKVLFDKAKIDAQRGRLDDALRECDSAIDAYLLIRKERAAGFISLKAAAVYRLRSDIFWAQDEHREGALARISALHLGMEFLENSSSESSGAIALAELAEDAQALKDHLDATSSKLGRRFRQDHVLGASWSLLQETYIDGDVAADRSWISSIDRLRHQLAEDLPPALMRQGLR